MENLTKSDANVLQKYMVKQKCLMITPDGRENLVRLYRFCPKDKTFEQSAQIIHIFDCPKLHSTEYRRQPTLCNEAAEQLFGFQCILPTKKLTEQVNYYLKSESLNSTEDNRGGRTGTADMAIAIKTLQVEIMRVLVIQRSCR